METASSVATEAIIAIKTVQSLGVETIFLDKFRKSLNEACSAKRGTIYWRGLVMGLGLYMPLFICCCCFVYGATLIVNGLLEYKVILLINQAMVFAAFMMGQALIYTSSFNKVNSSAARILSVINREPLVKTHTHVLDNEDWSATGRLSINDVKFTYPTRVKEEVLRGINLNVEAGTTVGLVGASGCGKSTILQLLLRFYDPDTGTINLDGVNTKSSLTLPRLRQQFGVVQQEPVLLDRTLAENIAYGDNSRQIDMNEIIEACKTANIHTFITSLPKGYGTCLGAGGAQLSGGQRQRVCVARALVRAPRLLLLDEATSALDAAGERVVAEALHEAAKGRTSVMVAHRLSTVENADVIFVLHEGRIVERGNHKDLMSVKGLYYRMYREQTVV